MIGLFGCATLKNSTCCDKKTQCTKQTECCDKTKSEGH